MLSLSALFYILAKVQVGLSDKDLLFIKPAWVFLSISDFSWCCVISGFLFFFVVQCRTFLFSFSFAQYWQGYVNLPLENYLVTLNQKCSSLFPFSSKGKDFLNLGPWLVSVIECHVDSFKVPFSHWKAEDVLPKVLSTSHIWVFILLDVWIFTLTSLGQRYVPVVRGLRSF